MTNLSWNEIQDRAQEFASKWQGETYEKGESQSFWSDFLGIYGVDRRRHGAFFEYAIKKGSGKQGFIDMFWPGKLLAEQKSGGKDLSKANTQAYEYLETMPDHDLPQAIVVSDFTSFEFIDLETREKTSFVLEDLPHNVKLFAFLIDQATQKTQEEHPVNIKAAEAMARLHNQLYDDNYRGHDLELLLVRLVFCMFADDSGIFDHQVLYGYLQNRTSDDGSDLGGRLKDIFETLNTDTSERQSSLDETLMSLPYVNGGLFAENIRTPHFSGKMRADLLEAMQLDWSKVSPAIFGSMFQGVMDAETRRNLGAHYTSEKNILRVIKPLFLDDLYIEFAKCMAAGPRKKYDELRKFQEKLASLKFLDPACGCGNFLVVTYRELRLLEHKVVAALAKNRDQIDMLATAGEGSGTLKVNVDQMYGIEIEEFPSLIAQTAIWLTDHQMNMQYSRESGRTFRRLPLKHSATIAHANALTTDWADVIAPKDLNFILGNPPFVGKNQRDDHQAESMAHVFADIKNDWKSLDFVSSWHVQACKVMAENNNIEAALVSTNSITQGEQVSVLWPYLAKLGIRINFAHRTFQWTNDAKGVAAVHCVIIGFSLRSKKDKRIFEYVDIKGEPNEISAKEINPYLIDAPDIIVYPRMKPINEVSQMLNGSKPADGGFLLLTPTDREYILSTEPQAEKYIRILVGADEFLNAGERYCLWLINCPPEELRSMPKVLGFVEGVRAFRSSSKKTQTRDLATTPTLFAEIRAPESGNYLLVPKVSSERRTYVPIGFMSHRAITTDRNHMIPSATLYEFGVITSKMHMSWLSALCGRMKSDFNYSSKLVYNTFVWPNATDEQRSDVEKLAQAVLDARAEFPDASLADLYDPLTMPPTLAKAHKALDRYVDRLYSPRGFDSDADRVAMLFERYKEAAL